MRLLVEGLVVGVGADASDPHRIAVGLGVGDALGAGGAARSADVLNHDLLAQNFAHPLGHDAAQHVLWSTGSERDNHCHRPRRVALRAGHARHGQEHGGAG